MRSGFRILILAMVCLVACSQGASRHRDIIDRAAAVVADYPDSAIAILEIIDPADLTIDSLKAEYYYILAYAHDSNDRLHLSDSLIEFSAGYYRDRDRKKALESATLLALYHYWRGDGRTAIRQLDSLSNLQDVPDSLLLYPMRKRAYWESKVMDTGDNRQYIRRLIATDKDSSRHDLYKYWLYIDYIFNGDADSALTVLDELLGKAIADRNPTNQFSYEYERIGILEELGRYTEMIDAADRFQKKAPDNSINHYIYLWKSLAYFNMGLSDKAIEKLENADSCASVISDAEKAYYNSFSYLLKTFFDYQQTGRLKLIRMAQINNIQKDNILRGQIIQRESEQSALKIENKRLTLKARSERQMSVMVIIILSALLITGVLIWYSLDRRRKTIEAEERAEALDKMVEELKKPAVQSTGQEALRRAMLQQLGIIKMVAETPTEQNREMLRKISSIESDTKGALVDWNNLYDIIDNLYAGFHTRLHSQYGDALSDKEEQIVVLMMAGFSTKEISVITSQTVATIYVRKSSVRKKLGLAEKEDIVAFLQRPGTL